VGHPPIQIVDKNDNPIGKGSMDEVQLKGLYHRIVMVTVNNPENEILIQKRAPDMFMAPNLWGASASGHVDAGERYSQAARREMKEEIGLVGELELVDIFKTNTKYGERTFNRFNGLFKTTAPKKYEFILAPDEVTEVRWVDVAELKKQLKTKPEDFTTSLKYLIEQYF